MVIIKNNIIDVPQLVITEPFIIERNIKYKTKATYCQSVIHYTEYLKQSFTSLIEVYYAEEENFSTCDANTKITFALIKVGY